MRYLFILIVIYFAQIIPTLSQWEKMPGSANDIGIGSDGSVWVVGTDVEQGGFGIHKWSGTTWDKYPGGAVRISVSNEGVPWVVNSSGDIFKLGSNGWIKIQGKATDIACGKDGSVWIIGTDAETGGFSIYKKTKNDWEKVKGSGIRISIDSQGSPWVINHDKQIFKREGGEWIALGGSANDIAAGHKESTWVIGTDIENGGFGIHKQSGNSWVKISGGAQNIAVDISGIPWVVNSEGNIFRKINENIHQQDERTSDLQLPWHLVDIWYTMNQPAIMNTFSIDIDVKNEIPEDCNLYIAPFGLGNINNVSFYGGIQSNIGGKKGIIFSRWGERSTEAIQIAEGGHYESAGYEGDFISVRNEFKWKKGKYKLTLFSTKKRKVINTVLHSFVGMKIHSYSDNSEQIAGYLAFPGDIIKLEKSLALFVELYGTKISLSKVPKLNITFSNFKINGNYFEIPQVSAYYPNKWPHMASVSFVSGKLNVNIGYKSQRNVDYRQEYSIEKIK